MAHVVHLVNREYEAMARDYYTLGFLDRVRSLHSPGFDTLDSLQLAKSAVKSCLQFDFLKLERVS